MALLDDPVPTVVISDFGRDAALRFCVDLARRELEQIATQLPAGALFYDEYRRLTLHLVGDLPFLKAPWLAPYRADDRPLDDGVMVGFDGGLTTADVTARIAVLVVETLAGPAARGADRALVALPCNTLAPVSWALREAFVSAERLTALVRQGGGDPPGLAVVAERLVGKVAFPTVPEAVLAQCAAEHVDVLLPLGTRRIVEIYQRAAAEQGATTTIARPDDPWQEQIFGAIQAAIAADPRRRPASEQALRAIAQAARQRFGASTAVVEACTDLDYGVGLSSAESYARHLVDIVYGRRLSPLRTPTPWTR